MKIKALFTALLFSVLSYAQNGIIRGTVYEDETSEAPFTRMLKYLLQVQWHSQISTETLN